MPYKKKELPDTKFDELPSKVIDVIAAVLDHKSA
jgi:hypothetical protein